MNVFLWNARARNGHVEATLNHPFPAQVDETFEHCPGWDVLRPHDELIAVNGDLLIEIDAEAFATLVARLRAIPRPLRLTFAKGAGRERAFAAQQRARLAARARDDACAKPLLLHGHAHAAHAHEDVDTQMLDPPKVDKTTCDLADPPRPPGEPGDRLQDDAALAPACGFMCFGVQYTCDCDVAYEAASASDPDAPGRLL